MSPLTLARCHLIDIAKVIIIRAIANDSKKNVAERLKIVYFAVGND